MLNKTSLKYYRDNEKINIKDFYCPKKFNPDLVKGYHENRFEDKDYENIGFSITDFNVDEKGDRSGCGQCKIKFGGGASFSGLAYNTKCNGNEPVEYEGYIKTYNFFNCNCNYDNCNCNYDNNNVDEIVCSLNDSDDSDDLPFVEIRASPINDDGIELLGNCILFNLKYTDI